MPFKRKTKKVHKMQATQKMSKIKKNFGNKFNKHEPKSNTQSQATRQSRGVKQHMT